MILFLSDTIPPGIILIRKLLVVMSEHGIEVRIPFLPADVFTWTY